MGYAPRVPFADGLKATIAWYAENRPWWEPLDRPAPPQRPAS
jgi:dTDP-glucose 4,6-dehydratase